MPALPYNVPDVVVELSQKIEGVKASIKQGQDEMKTIQTDIQTSVDHLAAKRDKELQVSIKAAEKAARETKRAVSKRERESKKKAKEDKKESPSPLLKKLVEVLSKRETIEKKKKGELVTTSKDTEYDAATAKSGSGFFDRSKEHSRAIKDKLAKTTKHGQDMWLGYYLAGMGLIGNALKDQMSGVENAVRDRLSQIWDDHWGKILAGGAVALTGPLALLYGGAKAFSWTARKGLSLTGKALGLGGAAASKLTKGKPPKITTPKTSTPKTPRPKGDAARARRAKKSRGMSKGKPPKPTTPKSTPTPPAPKKDSTVTKAVNALKNKSGKLGKLAVKAAGPIGLLISVGLTWKEAHELLTDPHKLDQFRAQWPDGLGWQTLEAFLNPASWASMLAEDLIDYGSYKAEDANVRANKHMEKPARRTRMGRNAAGQVTVELLPIDPGHQKKYDEWLKLQQHKKQKIDFILKHNSELTREQLESAPIRFIMAWFDQIKNQTGLNEDVKTREREAQKRREADDAADKAEAFRRSKMTTEQLFDDYYRGKITPNEQRLDDETESSHELRSVSPEMKERIQSRINSPYDLTQPVTVSSVNNNFFTEREKPISDMFTHDKNVV